MAEPEIYSISFGNQGSCMECCQDIAKQLCESTGLLLGDGKGHTNNTCWLSDNEESVGFCFQEDSDDKNYIRCSTINRKGVGAFTTGHFKQTSTTPFLLDYCYSKNNTAMIVGIRNMSSGTFIGTLFNAPMLVAKDLSGRYAGVNGSFSSDEPQWELIPSNQEGQLDSYSRLQGINISSLYTHTTLTKPTISRGADLFNGVLFSDLYFVQAFNEELDPRNKVITYDDDNDFFFVGSNQHLGGAAPAKKTIPGLPQFTIGQLIAIRT